MEIDIIKEFLDKKNIIGFIGASNNKEKWGYKKYKSLKDAGYTVYPINPKYSDIFGDKCFSDIKSLIDFLNKAPDLLITIIPPKITEKVVRDCKRYGINKVWMQPGSESESAILFCKENDIEVIYGICIIVDALNKL